VDGFSSVFPGWQFSHCFASAITMLLLKEKNKNYTGPSSFHFFLDYYTFVW